MDVDCDADVAPGDLIECTIEVTNTSTNDGNPANLRGPVVIHYDVFDTEYWVDSVTGLGPLLGDSNHVPGTIISNENLPNNYNDTYNYNYHLY